MNDDNLTSENNTSTEETTVQTKQTSTVHKSSNVRRGRKTRAIKDAFDSITTEKVLVEDVAKEFGLSNINVLRQGKRFDEHNREMGLGRVRVTQARRKEGDKRLYIYREENSKDNS